MHNLVLQFHQSPYQSLRTGWATADVDIHGKEMINALKDGIAAIHPTGRGTGSHSNYPFWFRHLIIDTLYRQGHLVRHRSCYDHHIGLARGEAHDLSPESSDVESGSARRHQLDRATGQTHRHWPKRILPHPIDTSIQLGKDDVAFHF